MSLLVKELFAFLTENFSFKHPLLLALSGGVDSIALFYALLECEKKRPFSWSVAHVDHGWRQESASEASQLSNLAKKWDIPFFLKTLNLTQIKGNLESACRLERLAFFKELKKMHGFEAILLGHHADDFIETILKRIFEKGALTHLWGMQPVQVVFELPLWRPFLGIPKKELKDWVLLHQRTFFDDSTNLDQKFLRGRMRTSLLPILSESFGKEIGAPLVRLAKESQELQSFMEGHLRLFFESGVSGPFGIFFDLSKLCLKSEFELKFFLREILKKRGDFLPYSLLHLAVKFLKEGAANRKISFRDVHLVIDRKRIFFLKRLFFGQWKLQTQLLDSIEKVQLPDWRSLWKGRQEALLPLDDYKWIYPSGKETFVEQKKLNKWWSNQKVPAFLRDVLPLILKNDQICYELLTGKEFKKVPLSKKGLRLILEPVALDFSGSALTGSGDLI